MRKKLLSLAIVLLLFSSVLASFTGSYCARARETERFSDIPPQAAGKPVDRAIHMLRQLGVTNGVGNNRFGFGQTIKRCQFVTFLGRLMGWKLIEPEKGSFLDNQDKSLYYYGYIETAVKLGVIEPDTPYFRPEEDITREDMAVMIVRSLGFDNLAKKLEEEESPFPDVTRHRGYITLAADFGIINGKVRNGKSVFAPSELATREEAALMMIRMYERLTSGIELLHGFYAQGSGSQMDLISDLDAVSFSWCNLGFDLDRNLPILEIGRIPKGFVMPLELAREKGIPALLSVYAAQSTSITDSNGSPVSLLRYVLTDENNRKTLAAEISRLIEAVEKDGEAARFDGVVIDFEEMRGNDLREGFVLFLKELKAQLQASGKLLYAAVHPARKPGLSYYDAYDFKAIAETVDMVILMAHDYNSKALSDWEIDSNYTFTPLAPIDEVYTAIKAITHGETGVADRQKLMLQLNFSSAQWQSRDGKVLNRMPYVPTYEMIRKRFHNEDGMEMGDLKIEYFKEVESPRLSYFNVTENISNTIWYEDERSTEAKIKLAKMMGINNISLWRLGNIPDYRDPGDLPLKLSVWELINKLR